jgi:phage repressor protein C with HTH and peptisase S24 domain
MVMRTVGQRIRRARQLRGLTQADVARRLGNVERGAVGNWERDQGIKTENLIMLARALDCSVEWLAKGKGPPPPSDSGAADSPDHDYTALAVGQSYQPQLAGARPEIDVRAGAGEGAIGEHEALTLGNGGVVTGHRVLAEWYFPPAFLRGELKAVPDRTIVMEVQGDSMIPTLQPGERVIVDTGQAAFGPDAIYVIDDGDGEPRVKRLRKVLATDRIEIVSDNPTAQRNDIMPRDQLRIVGRVVGRISKL